MCGIAGLFQFDRTPVAADLVAMADSLAHRGPDQSGTWMHEHPVHTIGLAHRRLSIRDLSLAGQQPFCSVSGNTIVTYNGELYNDAAIAARIARDYGVSIRTTCDTEVLTEAIDCQGAAAIQAFNGIFAFGAYDLKRGTLLLCRDALGVKPLYLWRDPSRKTIAFASEVKAFLALNSFGRKIDDQSLAALLAQGYVGPGRSLMKDVVSVLPGQVLEISPVGEVAELFRLRARGTTYSGHLSNSITDDASYLRPHLEDAVARQRTSDVPLAVWQSGGVDSSLINVACGQPRPQVLSLTSRHDDFDELADARKVASHIGCEIQPISIEDIDQSPQETFASLVWHVDGELADSSALAVKRLSAATKPFATVVLSGDGADEFFGGYATYTATRWASRFGHFFPKGVAHSLSRLCFRASSASRARYPTLDWAGRFVQGLPEGLLAHAEWRRYAMPWHFQRLFGADQKHGAIEALADYRAAILQAVAEAPEGTPEQWSQVSDVMHYLPGDMLMKVDRMSMAHGLEVRVPFLDSAFLACVEQLPVSARVPNNGVSKPVLRRMLASYGFSRSIFDRKKSGLNIALALELRTTYRETLTELLMDGDYVQPALEPGAIRQICQEHLSGSANHAYLIWAMMTFAQWRKHLGQ